LSESKSIQEQRKFDTSVCISSAGRAVYRLSQTNWLWWLIQSRAIWKLLHFLPISQGQINKKLVFEEFAHYYQTADKE